MGPAGLSPRPSQQAVSQPPSQLVFTAAPFRLGDCQTRCRGELKKASLREDTRTPWLAGGALQQVGFDYLGVILSLVTQTTPILGQLISLKELERGLPGALMHNGGS